MIDEKLIYKTVMDTLLKMDPYSDNIALQESLNSDYDLEKDCFGSEIRFTGDKRYFDMMDLMEKPYCTSPNREEFIAAIAKMITPEQAEIFPVFPIFSFDPTDPPAQPLSWVAKYVRPQLAVKIEELVKGMIQKHFVICMGSRNGEKLYMRNYLFGLVSTYAFIKNTPLTEPAINWFYNIIKASGVSAHLRVQTANEVLPHEGALTGDSSHGKIPMHMPIPDKREIIPYDLASKVIENAYSTAIIPCICRLVTAKKGKKECKHPIDGYCMMLDEVADSVIASGFGVRKTKEEMLDILKECRDRGLVQQVDNANRPLAMCNCCKDCCALLNSLARGERTLSKPSRFVAKSAGKCRECRSCIKSCPMDAIRMTIAGAMVLTNKCIGCGLCAVNCQFGVIVLEKRDSKIVKERDRKRLSRIYL